MLTKKIMKSKIFILGLTTAMLSIIIPMEALSMVAATGGLKGLLYWDDVKTPVENGVVKIRSIETGKEYSSPPSDKKGAYLMPDVPEGRYTLGVSTDSGDYNFDFEVFVKGGETAKLNMALKTTDPMVFLAKAKKPFFLKPVGIAVVMGAAGGLVFAGMKLFPGEEEPKSPSRK